MKRIANLSLISIIAAGASFTACKHDGGSAAQGDAAAASAAQEIAVPVPDLYVDPSGARALMLKQPFTVAPTNTLAFKLTDAAGNLLVGPIKTIKIMVIGATAQLPQQLRLDGETVDGDRSKAGIVPLPLLPVEGDGDEDLQQLLLGRTAMIDLSSAASEVGKIATLQIEVDLGNPADMASQYQVFTGYQQSGPFYPTLSSVGQAQFGAAAAIPQYGRYHTYTPQYQTYSLPSPVAYPQANYALPGRSYNNFGYGGVAPQASLPTPTYGSYY
jgi:hypothetical protein